MTDADYENMSAFTCGVKELDEFFGNEIRKCVERRYLSAYSAILSSGEIIAAFTLMNDALMIIEEADKKDFIDGLRFETDADTVEFFNRQTSYPSINIGHLGTLLPYQCKGTGMAIVEFVAETFLHYRQSGCQFITVDALNNLRTLKFYLKNGFSFQTNKDFYWSTRRMYRIL